MVIEYLTFQVAVDEQPDWLDADEATWSRFLERQPGFVSKQMWRERDRPDELHAVITWEDEASWRAIPQAELDAVDARMACWLRAPTCRVFDVVRDS